MNIRKWVTEEVLILLDEGCEISLDKDFKRYYSKKGETYNFIFPNNEFEYHTSQFMEMVRNLEVSERKYYIRKKEEKFVLKLISSTTDKVSMGKGFKGNEERIREDRKRANDKIKRSLGIRTK